MFGFLKERIDYFFGRGQHSIFVPVMDGALKPNEFLDQVKVICEKKYVDNLLIAGNKVLCSAEAQVLLIQPSGKLKILHTFDSQITGLAYNNESGDLAVALLEGRVVVCALENFRIKNEFNEDSVTSLMYHNNYLIYTKGSKKYQADNWKTDLMSIGKTGSVLLNALDKNPSKILLDNLAWPAGITMINRSTFCVSEAWSHRISFFNFDEDSVSIFKDKRVIDKLPAYPGRLFYESSSNCLWVAFFAPRNQLVEFILTEDEFRNRMVKEIDPDLWAAPCLRSGKHISEPLQQSGIKTMGYLKPWAPAFSYGLIVKFDIDLIAQESFHSRTNGSFHGTTSVAIDPKGHVLVTSKGDGKIGMWK